MIWHQDESKSEDPVYSRAVRKSGEAEACE